jgi:ubiquinone/menaquinone biosynthesis C-methylase UbiE
MKQIPLIDHPIDRFYSNASEETRLQMGLGPLEFERNKELILRYLTKKRSVILDVGGGPGLYAAWLAELGHSVHLIDPVKKHIEQAGKRAAGLKNPFTVLLAESQRLDFPDSKADVVILHGPLYHLQQKQERLRAIREAKRSLKKGGYVLGFAINRSASTIACLLNGLIHNKAFFEMCREELSSGHHHPPAKWPGVLPKAYFHDPVELQKEFEEAGLECVALNAVEGCVWLDKDYFQNRSAPEKSNVLKALLKLTEQDTSLLAFSPHMMIAARKP